MLFRSARAGRSRDALRMLAPARYRFLTRWMDRDFGHEDIQWDTTFLVTEKLYNDLTTQRGGMSPEDLQSLARPEQNTLPNEEVDRLSEMHYAYGRGFNIVRGELDPAFPNTEYMLRAYQLSEPPDQGWDLWRDVFSARGGRQQSADNQVWTWILNERGVYKLLRAMAEDVMALSYLGWIAAGTARWLKHLEWFAERGLVNLTRDQIVAAQAEMARVSARESVATASAVGGAIGAIGGPVMAVVIGVLGLVANLLFELGGAAYAINCPRPLVLRSGTEGECNFVDGPPGQIAERVAGTIITPQPTQSPPSPPPLSFPITPPTPKKQVPWLGLAAVSAVAIGGAIVYRRTR